MVTRINKTLAFGEKLKRLREAAGLSVSQLAVAAGVQRQSIYRFEDGANKPTADVLFRLADALKVSAEELR